MSHPETRPLSGCAYAQLVIDIFHGTAEVGKELPCSAARVTCDGIAHAIRYNDQLYARVISAQTRKESPEACTNLKEQVASGSLLQKLLALEDGRLEPAGPDGPYDDDDPALLHEKLYRERFPEVGPELPHEQTS